MSFELKITVPSDSSVMSNGWSRNSIFRIIDAGGVIEADGLMEVYRNLEKKLKVDFASRVLLSSKLSRSQLEELLQNHKRSKNIRNIAMVKQPELTNAEANEFMEDFTKQCCRSFLKDHLNCSSLSWGATGRKLGNVMLLFDLEEGFPTLPRWVREESKRRHNSSRSIELFPEDVLYGLSCEIAKAFDREVFNRASNYTTSGNTWWVSTYLAAICSGQKTSPLAPLMSSANESLAASAAKAFLYLTDKERGF